MTEERALLRSTFNRDAVLYDGVRPGYPEELFDNIVALSGIPDGGRILEFGCGTGIATVPFARRGYKILCVELGEQFAAVARKNLAPTRMPTSIPARLRSGRLRKARSI